MSSIYQRRNGFWYYQRYERGKKLRLSMEVRKKKEAVKEQNRLDKKSFSELFKQRMTSEHDGNQIAYVFDRFLRSKKSILRPGSLVRYQESLWGFQKFFKSIRISSLAELTSLHMSKYLKKRRDQGRAFKTIRCEFDLISQVLSYAKDVILVEDIPDIRFPKFKIPPARPERLGCYTPTQVKKIRVYFREHVPEFLPVFEFLVYTGCRLGGDEESQEIRC